MGRIKKYRIKDKGRGWEVEIANTLEEAKEFIEEYEEQDKRNEVYEEDYYVIEEIYIDDLKQV